MWYNNLYKNGGGFMEKIYLDCDGVILDTESGLFDRYYELKKLNPNLKRGQYLAELDWNMWISQCQVLKDAVTILNNYDPKVADILTKVHSLQEAKAKIDYFRSQRVKNNIIIVPSNVKKSSVVDAGGNILVDDSTSNLVDWQVENGIPFYFGGEVTSFAKVDTLDDVLNPQKRKVMLRTF